MYIYSEKTKKKYNTVEECEKAEKAFDEEIERARLKKEKLASEREVRAKEVEDAYKVAYDARKKADELRDKFAEDYNGYNFTFRTNGIFPISIFDFFFD